MDRFFKITASGLGVGYLPVAPGTFGSLVAIPLVLLLHSLTLTTYLATAITFSFLASWIADHAQTLFNSQDPSTIVIDEIAGMLFVFAGQDPNWLTIATGFVLFRALDIWKPFPCRWIDRHVHNGFGVVFDDVIAGVYANILLWILVYYFPHN